MAQGGAGARVNLVPWFPEIAVGAGLLALLPGFLALRRAPVRPRPGDFTLPLGLVVGAGIVLDVLISARTGGALALGGVTAILTAALAASALPAPTAACSTWGAALLGIGALFEIFGSAAGMDDGGWKLFAQLAAAFALGFSLVTAVRPNQPIPDAADGGVFAAVAAIVVASATPFVANRVDGVALPVLIAVAAIGSPLIELGWKPTALAGKVAAPAIVALVVLAVAAGLDPVALGRDENPTAPAAPAIAALLGIALGAVLVLVRDWRWATAAALAALAAFHWLGPFGAALGGIAAVAGAGMSRRAGAAATVLGAFALLAASHAGSPLVTPSHPGGWVVAVVGSLAVVALAAFGGGPRLALLRVVFLEWIVIAPLLNS